MIKHSLILFFALLVPWSLLAEDAFVRGMRVYLLDQPQMRAEKLIQIKRGTKVSILTKEKIYSQIIYQGQNGWVMSRLLSKKPIGTRVSLLSQNTNIKSFARKRASSYSSTAAARGLTKSGASSVSRIGTTNEAQLLKLEAQKIDPEQAMIFIQNEH